MPKRSRFPQEPDTRPGARASRPTKPAAAPKSKRSRQEAETLPPPAPSSRRGKAGEEGRISGIKSKRPAAPKSVGPRANVDEVTADLTKDPRRDDD